MPNFFVLHVAIQLSENHFLKGLFFLLLNGFGTLGKNYLTGGMEIFLDFEFYSICPYVYSYASVTLDYTGS